MPESPLQAAGAQIQPTAAAPLHTNEFFTGLWTQGSPFGPGPVPYLYQKFYSASRYDRLIGGENTEVTTRLTLARRPGNSIYNPGPFPPINRFFAFRNFGPSGENVRLLASCDPSTGGTQGTVRDATGPASNVVLQTKDPAAGRTSFVSVGNECFWGDGVSTMKFLLSKKAWAPNTSFNAGDFIIDPANNVQECIGAWTGKIVNIQVQPYSMPRTPIPGYILGHLVDIFFDPTTPPPEFPSVWLALAGLTAVPALNGQRYPFMWKSAVQLEVFLANSTITLPTVAYTTETGTATTGTNITGAVQPPWGVGPGSNTQDNTAQWVSQGPAVTEWGLDGPTSAPSVTQAKAPTTYQSWAANTWYAPLFVIVDSNGNLQQLTTGGTTGGGAPAWNVTVGGVTNDNTAQWTNKGPGAWPPNTAVTVGQLLVVTYSYFITITVTQGVWNGYTYIPTPVQVQQQVTVTQLFKCVTAGTTAASAPSWVNGLNTITTESSGVAWQNLGQPSTWATIGAAQNVSTATTIEDSNGYLETPQYLGKTGATPPTWPTQQGALTSDGTATWSNAGAYAAAQPLPWIYGYSGASSVTGHISNMSPPSAPITIGAGNLAVIQGVGLPDTSEDQIVIWRTKGGGSTFFEIGRMPNPGVNIQTGSAISWVYTDTTPDSAITSTALQAPIGLDNSPPPVGFIPCCYYLNRIWGFVGNVLKYSGGPDTLTGSGNEAFPPDNQFALPSTGVTCWPTSIGLVVVTNSDLWILLGQGTFDGSGNPISPFYLVNFQQGVGILSQDAFTVNGSTAYAMLASGQVVSMDPGAGETEVGFPVGDIFDTAYNPALAYLTWHQGRSQDTALFAADGGRFWLRMAAVAAPESGNVWSPPAQIASPGKVKAIASVETSPGIRSLVIGPAVDGNPILVRDYTTWQDAGVSYPATAYIASVVLAQPGVVAGVQFVVTEEKMIAGATPLSVALLFDEILSTQVPSSSFLTLRKKSQDPPNLPASKSIRAQRLWAAQDANTVVKCRHYQQALLWATENYPNEIYTNTVYGRLPEKARK